MMLHAARPVVLDFAFLSTIRIQSSRGDTDQVTLACYFEAGPQHSETTIRLSRGTVTELSRLTIPDTHICLISKRGSYQLDTINHRSFDLYLTRDDVLEVPIPSEMRGAAFSLATLPANGIVYWAPVTINAGKAILSLESETRDLVALGYDNGDLSYLIANGILLDSLEYSINVQEATGQPAVGTSVHLLARRLLGIGLEGYFTRDSLRRWFSFGRARTDERGQATLKAIAIDGTEAILEKGGHSQFEELSGERTEVQIKLEE